MTGYLIKLPQRLGSKPVVYAHTGENDILDYDHFCEIKTLCTPVVDLWQTLIATIGGKDYVLLIDEEGTFKEENEVNLLASVLCGQPVVGDVFLCRARGEDFIYLTPTERYQVLGAFLSKDEVMRTYSYTLW